MRENPRAARPAVANTARLAPLVASETVVEFTLDDATSTKGGLFGLGQNYDVGRGFGGGVTHRDDISTSGRIQSVVDPNDIRDRLKEAPAQTLGEAVAHALLGHAIGFVLNPRAPGDTTNQRAVDAENRVRRRGGSGRGILTTHPGGFPTN